LIGDLKHNIPETSLQEISDIPYFINEISQYLQENIYNKGES